MEYGNDRRFGWAQRTAAWDQHQACVFAAEHEQRQRESRRGAKAHLRQFPRDANSRLDTCAVSSVHGRVPTKFESAAASLVRVPVRTIRRHDQRSSNHIVFSARWLGSCLHAPHHHHEHAQSGRFERPEGTTRFKSRRPFRNIFIAAAFSLQFRYIFTTPQFTLGKPLFTHSTYPQVLNRKA